MLILEMQRPKEQNCREIAESAAIRLRQVTRLQQKPRVTPTTTTMCGEPNRKWRAPATNDHFTLMQFRSSDGEENKEKDNSKN